MSGLGIDGNGKVPERKALFNNNLKNIAPQRIDIDFTQSTEKLSEADWKESLGLHFSTDAVARIEKGMPTLEQFEVAFNPKPNNEELVNGLQDYLKTLPPVTKEQAFNITKEVNSFDANYGDMPEFQAS